VSPTYERPTYEHPTYEQAADVHSAGPANSCPRYEHGYRHVVAQVSSPEQTTYDRKFGTQPVRKLGTPVIRESDIDCIFSNEVG
jgi:hypothetical protein